MANLFKQGHVDLKFVTQNKEKIKRYKNIREGAMNSIFRMTILATFLIGILGFSCLVKSEPNDSEELVYHLCNTGVYHYDDPFANSLNYVLASLRDETPLTQGYDYYVTSPYPNNAPAYGHATCTSNVGYCAICVRNARSYLLTVCAGNIGGQVEFVDCSMRYEQYSFSK
ncbi:antifungal protein ginkbilobin-like protein [Nicotiana sylvestris]|uniref:antifungal protein ginkbilobin-like protein n=1 Tax=Nicotiana sylvestris TaxID=4096 RepID=UPI00388C82FD